MKPDEFRLTVGLSLLENLGPVTFHRWREAFGPPSEILKQTPQNLKRKAGRARIDFSKWHEEVLLKEADLEIKKARDHGINIITFFDALYPENLKNIFDPPILLYVKGTLPAAGLVCVAVVGSRTASLYGLRMAREIAKGLAEAGVTVVSGMALGVDSAAHEGALAGEGRTLAVLGGGIGRLYPAENKKLAKAISEQGALISEYPVEMEPQAGYFPVRNRIISGLSSSVLVVEAKEKSGALITADAALEQGRDVFAVPGNADSEKSRGTNALLKQGAKVVTSAEDILNELKLSKKVNVARPRPSLSTDESKIYTLLESEPLHVDVIVEQTGLSIQQAFTHLFQMELKGVVKQAPGKIFSIN